MKPRKSATKRHKTHKIIFCVFCASLWLIPPSQAQPDGYTLDQVFAKMDEVQKRFHSAAADIERTQMTVLELRPKNSAMFKSVQMWMDQQRWVAVQIKTTENSGDYMVLRFSNIKLNGNIPDSIFDLKMPKDVRVIKM